MTIFADIVNAPEYKSLTSASPQRKTERDAEDGLQRLQQRERERERERERRMREKTELNKMRARSL